MGSFIRLKTKRSHRWLVVCILLGLAAARFMYAPPPSSAAALVRSAAGANPSDIQATVDQFRADLGGSNNGVGGGSVVGRREINWDDVPDNLAAPNSLPADYYNTVSPRGIVFNSAVGPNFQVSANDVNPTSTPARFGNLNASYPASFKTFSAQRLFTASGTFITDITFFIPGTNIPATVKGFGAVFTDVDNNGATLVSCRDKDGNLLGSAIVPPSNNGLSFVGISFTQGERIASVRILSGNAGVGTDDVDGASSSSDVVVMDDFIYSEPQPLTNPNYFRWSGAGSDNKWSTPQNWVGNIAPNPNANPNITLEFPAGAAQLTSVNDFATAGSSATFNTIIFSGSGYNFQSPFAATGISLNSIRTSNSAGDNQLTMVTAFLGDGSIISGSAGTNLILAGNTALKGANKTVTLDGAGNLLVGANLSADFVSTSLVKNGSGTLLVRGALSAPTVLNSGAAVFDSTGSLARVTMNGGTLATARSDNLTSIFRGFGGVGSVNAVGGTIAPGGLDGYGVLLVPAQSQFPGATSDVGSLTLNPAATLDLDIVGPNPGEPSQPTFISSQFDRLEVTGPVDLGGAALKLHLNFTPVGTEQFTIIENKDVANLPPGFNPHFTTKGTFKNLPEGAIFQIGDTFFKITYRGGDGNDVVLSIVPKMSVNDVTVAEGNGSPATATFTISLSSPSNQPVTVEFSTVDGTAQAGSDYQARAGTRVFNPGEIEHTVTVPINGDTISEPDETFFLVLTDPGGAVLLRSVGTATITNDDGPPVQPALSIGNVTVTEGDTGSVNAVFTVTLSAAGNQAVSVDYLTSDGTAAAPDDYQFVNGTLTFNPGQTTRTITVPVKGDTAPELDETFFVNLMNATNATISQAQGVGTIKDNDPFGVLQLNQASYSVGEGAGSLAVTVTRTGDTSTGASVDFATADGSAQQKSDYSIAVGTLKFAPGETSKSIFIFITDDAYVEGNEAFNLTLSSPAGGTLGATTSAVITIVDNDTTPSTSNPIDQAAFFVRQHYVDFLNRDPDLVGYPAWINILNTCPPGDTRCDRVEVSSAFFRSDEFQGRGYFVYRFYSAALSRAPKYLEFMADLRRVTGFLSPQQLEDAKVDFVKDFMARAEFRQKYDALTDPTAYVNALLQAAGVTLPNKQQLITDLTQGTKTRAEVLRAVVESAEVSTKFFNEAFVVMQYFGYLRRDPDILYLQWIETLNRTNDYRTMVNGFMNSLEYRFRFNQ